MAHECRATGAHTVGPGSVIDWGAKLAEAGAGCDQPDDPFALRALACAVVAREKRTYAIGAVLLDEHNEVVCEGHNEVHVDGFHSDLHAEMVVMNKWERQHPYCCDMSKYTLVTSLEPCPMCMTRLIFSGVGAVRHVCNDDVGGMVQRMESLPPIFQQLTARSQQKWGKAQCSPALEAMAFDIWDSNREELDTQVVRRSVAEEKEGAGVKDN
jgi:cytosine deaminase